jgi:hypothetical protein
MNSPLLIEINTRPWLHELEAECRQPITLASVPESCLEAWVTEGISHVWLMGVWTTGPLSRERALAHESLWTAFDHALPGWTGEDVAGSPYAIEHYRVPEALGGDGGLALFRERLHGHGLKLMLDFVPNHVGLDHPWILQYPGFFVQTTAEQSGAFCSGNSTGCRRWIAHGRDPHFAPWDDTAQLDYRKAEVHRFMQAELLRVAERCDGLRCDMAMLLLRDVFERTWQDAAPAEGGEAPAKGDFWGEAIRRVKAHHPEFIFLAEVYWDLEQRLQELGFDYTYDKTLSDILIRGHPEDATRHLHAKSGDFIQRSAHFLENHDEARVADVLSVEKHRVSALVCLALPGLRFLHEGQTRGARIHAPVQLARRMQEPSDGAIQQMYQELFKGLKAAQVGQGNGELLLARPAWPENQTHQSILAVRWRSTDAAFSIVVGNLAAHRSQCRLPLESLAGTDHKWRLEDLLGPERWVRNAADLRHPGWFLDLPPHAAQIFRFTPVNKRVVD